MKHRGDGIFSGNISSKKATFSEVATGVTPVLSDHLATKGYVDAQVGGGAASPGFYGVIFKQSNAANGYRNDTLIFNSESFYLSGSSTNKPIVNWRGGSGGVSDHGALTGLADDDHTQYLLATGSRSVSGNFSALKDVNVGKDLEVFGSFYVANNVQANKIFVNDINFKKFKIAHDGVTLDIYNTDNTGTDPIVIGSGVDANVMTINRNDTTLSGGGAVLTLNSSFITASEVEFQILGSRIGRVGYSGGNVVLAGSVNDILTVAYDAPASSIVVNTAGDTKNLGRLGVGTTNIQTAVQLGAYSSTKGFLKPRMANANWAAISNPPAGLEVYDADFYVPVVRSRNTWEPITNSFAFLDMEDDFMGALLTTGNIGKYGWAFGGTAVTVIAGESDHPGILSQSCNNTFSSLACDQTLTTGTAEAFHASDFNYLCFILRTDPSTIANTELTCGLAAGSLAAQLTSATVGVFFKYDAAVDAFWHGFVNNVGTTSATTVVPVVANTWYRLEITYDGTTIRFYINGHLRQSSVNTNFPNEALKWFTQIRSTTAAARTYQIDYARLVGALHR